MATAPVIGINGLLTSDVCEMPVFVCSSNLASADVHGIATSPEFLSMDGKGRLGNDHEGWKPMSAVMNDLHTFWIHSVRVCGASSSDTGPRSSDRRVLFCHRKFQESSLALQNRAQNGHEKQVSKSRAKSGHEMWPKPWAPTVGARTFRHVLRPFSGLGYRAQGKAFILDPFWV